VRIYTGQGDDGTTGLYFGGRVRKDDPTIELNGEVDEAQASIGFARSCTQPGSELDELLIGIERDLWVLMAEVATAPENRRKLVGGKSLVTAEMVQGLEDSIDQLAERTKWPKDFVVPGQDQAAAALDVARTVVRRAERRTTTTRVEGSLVPTYLNRLSDLLWATARFREGDALRIAKSGS
jgi:cob(I)alamin adenosyltransferase